jgi:hypothetical protein
MQIPNTTLWIPPKFHQELMFYIHKCDTEVGGYGRIEFVKKDNHIFVDEIYLMPQVVEPAECTLSAEGLALLYEDLIEKGEEDKIGSINLWWHSHVDMGVSPSGQDEKHISEWPGNHLVSLIINRSGKMYANLMVRTPVFITGEIEAKVNWFDIDEAEEFEKDIELKVKKAPPIVYKKAGLSKPDSQESQGTQRFVDWDLCGNDKTKSIHDMTQDEWDKDQAELDAELYAEWEEEIEDLLRQQLGDEYIEMDEEERLAFKKSFACG